MIFPVLLAKFIDRDSKFLAEKFHASQHTGIQEIHLCKNVKGIILQVVYHSCTNDFLHLAKQAALGYFAGWIFDCLAIHPVSHNQMEYLPIALYRCAMYHR